MGHALKNHNHNEIDTAVNAIVEEFSQQGVAKKSNWKWIIKMEEMFIMRLPFLLVPNHQKYPSGCQHGYRNKYIMRYCIISYVCVPHFCFPSESLLFTPNPGHYMPNSPCSSPNGLLFNPKSASGNLPVSAVPYVRRGGWGCVACAKRVARNVRED